MAKPELVKSHCCTQMTSALEFDCNQHSTSRNCPDVLVEYSPQVNEYGLIIHDGGNASVLISFCPWYGKKLPTSMRSRWFEELEAVGIDPGVDEIPDAYQTDEWYS